MVEDILTLPYLCFQKTLLINLFNSNLRSWREKRIRLLLLSTSESLSYLCFQKTLLIELFDSNTSESFYTRFCEYCIEVSYPHSLVFQFLVLVMEDLRAPVAMLEQRRQELLRKMDQIIQLEEKFKHGIYLNKEELNMIKQKDETSWLIDEYDEIFNDLKKFVSQRQP